MRILLIDQDNHTLELLRTALIRAGYQVQIAVDGDSGFSFGSKPVT